MIIAGNNDYVIAVKANQHRLYRQLQTNIQRSSPISTSSHHERTRNRYTQRTVSVYDDLTDIAPDWVGLQRLIRVERTGTRHGQPYQQVAYYITSLTLAAQAFMHGIRGHWGIENRLHWVKDVVLHEDSSGIRHCAAASNLSIIRSLVMNVFRFHGYDSITQAIDCFANDLPAIFLLLE